VLRSPDKDFRRRVIPLKIKALNRVVNTLYTTRAAYEPPKLTAFGSVGSLTQSGSGMMDEMVMMGPQMMCQMNVMRNFC